MAPKIKAEDNPWYLLATFYGVPEQGNQALRDRNRIAWNRYFAANLDEETRTRLIYEKRHPAEELTPFSSDELKVEGAAKREGSAREMSLPAIGSKIDFSNTEFDRDASFEGYLFTSSSFQGATFSAGADFRGATFSGDANFDDATFSGDASFDGATFSAWASFSATFSGDASFSGVTFSRMAPSGAALFHGATFSGTADFYGATFSGDANFDVATFSSIASFSGATFSGDVSFRHATFSGTALFGGATFSAWADFSSATFSGFSGATFSGATFSGTASFSGAKFQTSSSFVNAEMKDTTSFEGAIFKTEPPKFFGAKLHQGTVWRGIVWPPKPQDKDEAGSFIDAYACLKLEMDRLKKHEDEFNFFALELQSHRVMQGLMRGLPIAFYGALSDYGRSYVRPLAWLFVIAVACAPVFWHFGAKAPIDSLGLSLANLLSVFGFRKDFNVPIDPLPAALKVLAATQTIVGGVLLFLFGLGIRNKFRMK